MEGLSSGGSHGRMRILERDGRDGSPPPISTPKPLTAPRTRSLPRPFEARVAVEGTQFALRAEPADSSGSYRLRVWIGTPDGQWRLLEGLHNNRTWDALGEPLAIGLSAIAASMGYHV